jgi:hypothetical protein
VSPRVLLATSLLLLTLSVVFGVLNTTKVVSMRAEQERGLARSAQVKGVHATQHAPYRREGAGISADTAKLAELEARAAKAESDAAQATTEKAAVTAKLQANESKLAQLQKTIEAFPPHAIEPAPEGPSVTELKSQLAEARRQLETAEKEKLFLTEKMQSPPPRSKPIQQQLPHRRATALPGLHGSVLAVNRAYDFVVLDLGARQGVEANAEMLVRRGRTLIGKIRISSVEPATAIGDIITSTLARGVQVQPGDIVTYAGTDP